MTAQEAAAALGVSVGTVYAYVSRGLLRSEPVAGTRRRRYRAEDVEALRRRNEARGDPTRAARDALHFHGMPVLDSGVTLIADGRLYYRGVDATVLAETRSLEQVATLLWGAPFPDECPTRSSLGWQRLAPHLNSLPRAQAFHAYLAAAAAADPAAFDLRPASVRRAGARILRGLAAVAVGSAPQARSTAATLAEAWKPRAAGAVRLLEAALVLCADHELNVSAFTARCVASAAATPYAAVTAALAALEGYKHGGHTERVTELFDEIQDGRDPRTQFLARQRRGQPIPGFGHPLYPDGDPRAAILMRLARGVRGKAAVHRAADAILDAARAMRIPPANLDFGLVWLSRALGLASGAPFLVFALGRTVGWIAHCLEQYETDRMIRPRARYTGPAPDAHAASI